MRLLGKMLQEVRVGASGKLAWLEMDLAQRLKHQASADDTQSFLNLLLLIRDTEVVCFFREEDDNRVRLSLKSKGRVVVNQLAMALGGGGHEFAAGVSLAAPMEKAVAQVVPQLEALIQQNSDLVFK